jgi:hypothetical protein
MLPAATTPNAAATAMWLFSQRLPPARRRSGSFEYVISAPVGEASAPEAHSFLLRRSNRDELSSNRANVVAVDSNQAASKVKPALEIETGHWPPFQCECRVIQNAQGEQSDTDFPAAIVLECESPRSEDEQADQRSQTEGRATI